ncbi:Putative armadillo-like helical, exportin-1/Importin-beta [Septoria linicola]|uniref:Armadillo-like helical, exportin-1/Importin-beta n=1 Tax=Septoria linicola TaxID=215465 RepID=A0A9Q9EIQ3_9PEZI|nr:putative armadillo-like helical, exportin-1/Importin-beta [Septoria linicola]USW51287.1 Putative armadillo-like helical, exportin-1/Importin-beta [Septoria linicola]
MDAHSEVNAPTSMEEVEQLVKRFYQHGNPKLIAQIDTQLKLLQHSPEGWQLADALLASQDQNVRFFAALTFQIKLNSDGAKLDAATAQSVLARLVSWTVRLDRAGEGTVVRKKLCGALATFLLQAPRQWPRPLLHLVASFAQGDVVSEDQLPASHDAISQYLPSLGESQLITLLWFCGELAAKVDSISAASGQVHGQMETIVQDVSRIIEHAMSRPTTQVSPRLRADCLACFLNWVNYAQPMWPTKPEALEYLRRLVPSLAVLLIDPAIQHDAMEVFRDILESYTTFFQQQQMELLGNIIYNHIRPRLLQALQDQEPEVISVAQLVIAYGIANIQEIVEKPDVEVTARVPLSLIMAILEAPGYPGDDDEASLHSIEFWNTYIEYVNELTYSNASIKTPLHWVASARSTCMTLTNLLWQKMRTPDSETAKDWGDDESEGFKEFRMDASDLMLSVYVFLGAEMLQSLVTIILNSLEQQHWQELEAALFGINNLADNVLEDQTAENILLPVFRSSLYRIVGDFNQSMPTQARRTAVDTLGSYGAFIERHAEFLPDTLRFLFASLQNPGLYLSAAKSIAELCSTCRSSLTGELDGFLAQYNNFAQGETSEPYTNEKVIGAIAAIVQAVRPESAKARPLSALLDIIDSTVVSARQTQDSEMVEILGVSAIDCLAAIGKNMQTEDDTPIDLYEDHTAPVDKESFWRTAEGQAIQQRILTTCQNVLEILPRNGEVVEGVCKVLKSGFVETEPGPFVFPPSYNIAFLEQCTLNTPNLESVLAMTCTLVQQYSRSNHPRLDDAIVRIYKKVISLVQLLGEPSRDPGVAQSCIDVFNRMIGRYTNILMDADGTGDMVAPILDFSLKALDGTDLMPKRAACTFWARIIKPDDQSTDEVVRTRLGQVVAAYGPMLTQALMSQITGRGQRSELEQICEPLKALLSTQPRSKQWIETALANRAALPAISEGVADSERSRFVAQLAAARGDTRRTRETVKHFYAACRGTVSSYSA